MNIKTIDDTFATTGQIQPADVATLKAAGYRAIVCARPDNEDAGQPSFAEIEKAARDAGLPIVHIPVSGTLTEGQIIRFHDAWKDLPKPVLGYCRSGGRAGSLYATL